MSAVTELELSLQRRIDSPLDVVWSVVVDPQVTVTGQTLLSTTGAPGAVGSTYDVEQALLGVLRVRARAEVLAVDPLRQVHVRTTPLARDGSALDRGGSEQVIDALPDGASSFLRCTLTAAVPRLLAGSSRRSLQTQLAGWFDAVEAESARRAAVRG
jgi:hypothetical protein